MADISAIKLPNGTTYNLKDTTARNAANSAVPNTRTVNGKALSSDISLGAGDVGAYTKKETDTKINAAIASAYKYKGSVTADKLPTSGQVVGDVYNITNDSSYGKAGMNVAWNGTTWDALGSNVDLSNYVTTSDSRLSNARPASDVYAWAKAAKKPSYSASEIGAAPASHTHTKDQVGLANVANLDQSKAIKSITRSGTTFTATALDGTTTTFTQQDNNTTYGLASQSSNGLMSAADKSKLDGIGAGSNVKSVNGKTGAVSLSKADVGLGNVDNTRDVDKRVLANNIQWGGNNISGAVSPLDVATSNLFAGNVMAYSNTNGIAVEYSTDGAATWKDYGADNNSKIRFVTPETGQAYFYLGKKSTAQTAAKDLLRITLDARKMGIYCSPRNILIEISTRGGTGSYVNIEYSTRASDTTFHNFGKYSIGGWSGWNSIPINNIPSGAFGTNGSDDQLVIIRLTFGFTGFKSGYESQTGVTIHRMSMIAISRWSVPSSMGSVNSIYRLDEHQNATFPAKVSATSFSGASATSSADGLMSKADKAKLDGIGTGSNVKSVNGKTGAVTLAKGDVGLGNVDNTADSAKSVKYATSAGSANSVAWDNVSGRPSSLPANGGNSATVNGHTVNSDVPSGAKFTDTVTTVTITGSGNAVTEISASNGALTATKDATFATKQESSNHVIASKTQPSNQQAGDIWLIIK